jgi:hypothetical protein
MPAPFHSHILPFTRSLRYDIGKPKAHGPESVVSPSMFHLHSSRRLRRPRPRRGFTEFILHQIDGRHVTFRLFGCVLISFVHLIEISAVYDQKYYSLFPCFGKRAEPHQATSICVIASICGVTVW